MKHTGGNPWAFQTEGPVMAEVKEKVYSDEEIAAKLQETGLTEWYLEDGWLRRKYNTDGWPTTPE
jgi:4a-hydroxytetrahydrobiopterin dehydratase